ncbi:Polycomb group RING finger protein 5-A [Galdieria sulphuraria]|nr:Polycomb group RING finger protein 5-A [Galdieria sulphuraria]
MSLKTLEFFLREVFKLSLSVLFQIPTFYMFELENCCFIPLSIVNSLFTCSLCGGYWREATTIGDCLHTFCKTCIYRYIQQQGRCPRCWSKLSPRNEPWIYAREDTRLQEILRAILPQVKQDVEEFQTVSILSASNNTDLAPSAVLTSQDNNLRAENGADCCILQLTPLQGSTKPELQKPVLRVSADITIRQLKQYLQLKLYGSGNPEIELYSGHNILPSTVHIRSILQENSLILSLFYA